MKKLTLCLSLLGALFLSNCTAEEPEAPEEAKSTPVRVMQVQAEQRQEYLHFIGTIEIDREMKVSFKLGGKITRLNFEEGETVKKGDVMAELDTAELLARQEKALENLDKIKRDLKRTEKLFKQKAVSESSLQDARTAEKSLNAEIKIIKDNLKDSHIKAPFTGKILTKLAEQGEIVGAGTPIAVLVKLDPVVVKAATPDNLIPRIQLGKQVIIKVDWAPGKEFIGTIRRMETMADPVTRTIGFEILVPNPDETLKPGLLARVEIPFMENDPRIYVPLDSIIGFGADPFVFIVRDLKAEKRKIKTGRIIGADVEILDGLTPEELIAVSGQEYLRDNYPVSIENEDND